MGRTGGIPQRLRRQKHIRPSGMHIGKVLLPIRRAQRRAYIRLTAAVIVCNELELQRILPAVSEIIVFHTHILSYYADFTDTFSVLLSLCFRTSSYTSG